MKAAVGMLWLPAVAQAHAGVVVIQPPVSHEELHLQPPGTSPFHERDVPATSAHENHPTPGFLRDWRQAMALDDPLPAHEALARTMAHREFGKLDIVDRRATWSRAGWMAVRTNDLRQAHTWLLRALQAGSDNIDDYYLIAQIAAELGHAGAAAGYLTALAERWPARLDDLDAGVTFAITHEAPEANGVERRLLEALFASGWDNRGMGVGKLWYRLACLRLAAGDTQGIPEAIRRTDAPEALVSFRTDRRFDPWMERHAAGMDVARAAHLRVARLQDLVERRPDLLEARMELGYALLSVGRHDEVIALSDRTLAQIRAAPPGEPVFGDMRYEVWILDNRAHALARMERWDEAVAELERAALMEEQGQSLNLAQLLCDLGRTREAAAALAIPARATSHGKRRAASIRHCIALQEGDRAAARKAFGDIRRYREESTTSWIDALLRAGRARDAARVLRKALADEGRGNAMLSSLQIYRTPPRLPANQALFEGWRALAQRQDIKLAAERVGRIETFDIYEPYGY